MSTELRDSNLVTSTGNGAEPAESSAPTSASWQSNGNWVRRHARQRRRAGRRPGFCCHGRLIAIGNLVVLSFKLDNKNTAGTSQSAAAVEPAPPAPLGHTSATTLKEYTVTPRPSEVAAGRVSF